MPMERYPANGKGDPMTTHVVSDAIEAAVAAMTGPGGLYED